MVIIWLPGAKQHLKDIYLFYKGNRSLKTAIKVRTGLYLSVSSLLDFPKMGTIEVFSTKLKEEYRSLIVRKYFKIIYFIQHNTIYIAAIWDCRQDPKSNRKKIQ